MAHSAHPPRPYEDEKRVNERASPTTERSHPPTPYSTGKSPASPGPYAGHSRHGRQTSLGPTPTRSPQMSGEKGGPGYGDR